MLADLSRVIFGQAVFQRKVLRMLHQDRGVRAFDDVSELAAICEQKSSFRCRARRLAILHASGAGSTAVASTINAACYQVLISLRDSASVYESAGVTGTCEPGHSVSASARANIRHLIILSAR